MQFPVKAKFKDGTPVELVLAENGDVAAVQDLYRVIVEDVVFGNRTDDLSFQIWPFGD